MGHAKLGIKYKFTYFIFCLLLMINLRFRYSRLIWRMCVVRSFSFVGNVLLTNTMHYTQVCSLSEPVGKQFL